MHGIDEGILVYARVLLYVCQEALNKFKSNRVFRKGNDEIIRQ